MIKKKLIGRSCGQAGFSMVEISLSLLVVAMGLLVLMALFPAGLKEVESAVKNTRTAMFADDQFNGYQANVLRAENLTDFKSQTFVFGQAQTGDQTTTPHTTNSNGGFLQWKYFIKLTNSPITHNQMVWRVRLEVQNTPGPFVSPVVYYTELVYGVPPP